MKLENTFGTYPQTPSIKEQRPPSLASNLAGADAPSKARDLDFGRILRQEIPSSRLAATLPSPATPTDPTAVPLQNGNPAAVSLPAWCLGRNDYSDFLGRTNNAAQSVSSVSNVAATSPSVAPAIDPVTSQVKAVAKRSPWHLGRNDYSDLIRSSSIANEA